MVRFARRLGAIVTWLVVVLLVAIAILTAAMRLVLPNLDTAKAPIQRWASDASGFHVEFSTFKGHWRYLVPSLSLHDFSLSSTEGGQKILTADSIDMQFDLFASLQRREPTFSNISIDGLNVDVTQIPERKNTPDGSLKTQLERLFLVGLGQFAVHNASVTVMSPSDERKTINIESLRWDNQSGQHHVQGVVSVVGTSLNQVDIRGVFTESNGLGSLDGDFYLHAEDVSLRAWIAKFINPKITLSHAKVAGEAWLTVADGMPKTALVSLTNSAMAWHSKTPSLQAHDTLQSVSIENGHILLERSDDAGWRVATDNLAIKTGKELWPDPGLRAEFSDNEWKMSLAMLDLPLLLPLREVFDIPSGVEQAITSLAPSGQAKDIRIAKPTTSDITYSATFEDLAFKHWSYLPEVHKLQLALVGEGTNGKVTLAMQDDTLPYGEFFQAPLDIKQGDVTAFWDYNDDRVVIWSDSVAVRSPHLDVVGEFRLDIPFEGNSWLAFYAEASLSDAGETWRYLPTLALGHDLTDFLSAAIRVGQADLAKLVWYGDFSTFPYPEHQGVFQASVPLRNAKFSFDTQWPTLTGLDLDLLFQNDTLFLEASNVDLMGARGYDLKGEIPSLSNENGKLFIDAKIASSGKDLHQYMLATPLVDSVGAALTHVQVDGQVMGGISLAIPLNGDDVSVKGSASLNDSKVAIVNPPITLNNVKGKLEFDNDLIWAKNLKANLLNQPISVGFKGESEADNYLVNIDIAGKWQADKLKAALELPDLDFIEGRSSWDLDVGIALRDIGFTYDVLLDADLTQMDVNLPAPLEKSSFIKGHGYLKASGNGQALVGQVELPQLKYQADVDISGEKPTITRSRILMGEGELSLKPLSGNAVSVDVPLLDVLAWKEVLARYQQSQVGKKREMPVNVPSPSRVNVKAEKVLTGELTFNHFSLAAREKSDGFHILVGSEELSGDAWWDEDKFLTVSIEHLFLNIDLDDDVKLRDSTKKNPTATDMDRALMAKIPSTDLVINELWLQGYRIGRVESQLLKSGEKLTLSKFNLGSGSTQLTANGDWEITHQGINKSQFSFDIQGKNSSDLMGRFAVTGGIQDASVKTKGELRFEGAPWSMDIASLNGMLETKIEDGYVSGVGGAGRLLGLFSLDSILRKMQLDFTGVFEDGLAFDEISGSASITNGVVVTDNIQMKALAGDMFIKGIANLVKNQVNAEVRFIPDITSGIPVLTAFAVAPQTALYVLAVTTVLSPVVDAFTQVRYQVTGAIDDPLVREVSRSSSEVTLPEQATERLRTEQQGSK
ncbi:YhdP family protein [Enterovibrio calviensis]|uniref:YhdP family protein n=1 Tax=Enterovibrio calviensis TaxID=91359 RepID=UPI0037355294